MNNEEVMCGHPAEVMWLGRTKVGIELLWPDMEFVKNFTLPDFQAKNFTPSISPNFNSFSKKKHKK